MYAVYVTAQKAILEDHIVNETFNTQVALLYSSLRNKLIFVIWLQCFI